MWKKTDFYGIVAQAQDMVPGFKEGYRKFEQEVVLKRLSRGLLTNYGRNVAHNCHYISDVVRSQLRFEPNSANAA